MFGWRRRVPTVLQFQAAECGLAALSMLMGFHGCHVPLEELRRLSGLSGEGSSLAQLKRLADHYGFHARAYRKEPEALSALGFPCMVFVNFNHMLVVEDMADGVVRVNDPDGGRRSLGMAEFDRCFTGIALRLEPSPQMRRRAPHRAETLVALVRSCWLWWAGLLLLAMACGGAEIMVASGLDQERPGAVIAPLAALVIALLARHALLWAAGGVLRARTAVFVHDHLFSRSASFFGYRRLAGMAHMTRLPFILGQWVRGMAGATMLAMVSGLSALAALAWLSPPIALAVAAAWVVSGVATVRTYGATASAWRRQAQEGPGVGLGAVMTDLDPWQSACRDEDLLAAEATSALHTLRLDQPLARDEAVLRGLIVASVAMVFALAVQMSPGLAIPALTLLACRWWLDVPEAMPAFLALHQMRQACDDLAASPSHQPPRLALDQGPLAQCDTVAFAYGASPLFQAVSLTVDTGAVIGLTGHAGVGKSTLARILTGQLIPTAGSAHLRGRAALVPTTPVLFNASVTDNVTCWRPGIDGARVEWALRTACLWDDIAARPGGLDAMVEAGAGNFSGGQQRRLMLARALADGPALLVLDETLDAVDPATEARILANLRQAGMSIIVLSQRRETLMLCDRAWRLTATGCVALNWQAPDREPGHQPQAFPQWTQDSNPPALSAGAWKALATAAETLGIVLPDHPSPIPCPPHQHPLHWQARLHGLLLLPVALTERWARGGSAVLLARWRDGSEAVLTPSVLGGYRYRQEGGTWRRLGQDAAARLESSAWAVYRRGGARKIQSLWPDFLAALIGAAALWLGAGGLAAGFVPASIMAMAGATVALVLTRRRCRSALRLQGTIENTAHCLRLSAWWTRRQDETHLREWSDGAAVEKPDGVVSALMLSFSAIAIAVVAFLSADEVAVLAMAAGAALASAALAWKQSAAAKRAHSPLLAAQLLLDHVLLLMPSITATPLAQSLRKHWIMQGRSAGKFADRRDHWAAAGRLWRLLTPVLAAALGATLLASPQVPFMVLAAWAGMGLGEAAAALMLAWRMFQSRRPFRHAPREDAGAPPSQPARGLMADTVCFAYDRPILADVSLSVAPGEIVAIAGPSGCGKSTLLRLLLGTWQPQSGRISWDGHDLATCDRMAWRAHAAAIFQDEPMGLDLLHAQIRGRAWMDLDRVVAMLVAVGLWPKVASLPMGLACLVDNRMFSTGQAAQLMLARALARAPRLLFLDETLSALDPPTQRLVLALIRSRNITCILTSHQDAVLAQADRVLRLENGHLRQEQGTRPEPIMMAKSAEIAPPAPFGEAARLYRHKVLARLAGTRGDDIILPRLAPAPLALALAALLAAAMGLNG